MRKIALILGLALLFSLPSWSQTTSITITKVYSDASQTPLASFEFCLTPVGPDGQPTAITPSGGGQVLDGQHCWPGANGAVSGVTVPDTSTASPSGSGYRVQIEQPSGVMIYSYPQAIHPTGAAWSFDTWSPTQSITATPSQLATGSQIPPSCTAPSLYYDSGANAYVCIGTNYVKQASGNITGPLSVDAGNSAPAVTIIGSSTSGTNIALDTSVPGGHNYTLTDATDAHIGWFGINDTSANESILGLFGGSLPLVSVSGNAIFGFTPSTETLIAPDAAFSRDHTNAIDCGDGDPKNASCQFAAGTVIADGMTVGASGIASSGPVSGTALTAEGTTPGAASLVAGSGSIPALPANSAGFAAPNSGGTSYLFKLPADWIGGILYGSAPASGDGVSESVIAPATSGQVAAALGTPRTIYLSPVGDIGVQINAAVAELGQVGGEIILPATSDGSWTTTAMIPWRSISLVGRGPLASVFDCTVAGDCLVIHPDLYSPTNGLPAGGTVAGFSIVGNGAAGQVDIHGEDLEGWVLHDIVLDGASASGDACLKLEDMNYWTERNHTYNVQFGYGCATSVELYTNPSNPNSYGSFGYNDFEFAMQPGTNQVGLSMVGTMELYNGSLTIVANAQGNNPSVIQVSGDATATGENLWMNVEGMPGISNGNIFDITSTNANLQFTGAINDHPANPIGHSTLASGAELVVAGTQSFSNTTPPSIANNAASGYGYAYAGMVSCSNQPSGAPCIMTVGHSLGIDGSAMFYYQSPGSGVPNPIGGFGINGHNATTYFDNQGNFWSDGSLGIGNPSSLTAGPDTAFTRASAGIMALDGGSQGDASGWLQLSAIGSGSSGNTDLRGHLTLVSGTGTYTFSRAYSTAPTCTASDTSAANAVRVTASTTTLTVTGTGSDAVSYICAD